MKLVLALDCLALALPVGAQTVPPVSDAFRSELAAVPELAVVSETLAVAGVRLGFISAVSADRDGNLYVLHRPETGCRTRWCDPACRRGRGSEAEGEGFA